MFPPETHAPMDELVMHELAPWLNVVGAAEQSFAVEQVQALHARVSVVAA